MSRFQQNRERFFVLEICRLALEIANRLYYYRFVRLKGIFLKFSVNKRDKMRLHLPSSYAYEASFASQNFEEVKQ
jgi:hypothetical protein